MPTSPLKIANHTSYFKSAARELVEAIRDVGVAQTCGLTIEDDGITLCSEIDGQQTCFRHSFQDAALVRRATQKNQALLKACSNKKNTILRVLDLTAGWGRDSFILASQGKQVTMIENHPLVFQCVHYLLHIARAQESTSVFDRLQLHQDHALYHVHQMQPDACDCIYLDPMFPAHKSKAKPGKELQLLQLLTDNTDIEEVFSAALAQPVSRVVVKRPLHAPWLGQRQPDLDYREKTIRFDVYLNNQNS